MQTLIEAKKVKAKTLTDIPLSRAHLAQQAALMRLQLWFTGETHRLIAEFGQKAASHVRGNAGSDGLFDGGKLFMAQRQILSAWDHFFIEQWLPLFQAARREAASIPFGTLAIYHEKYLRPKAKKLQEATSPGPVFEPQLAALLESAGQRIYGDGLTLSSRIWKFDRDSREGINRTLMAGIAEKKSAWQIAKELEGYLGANQDCPRWTATRLYTLTKKDIASGDRRGLKTGAECEGQGVAYKALRMARTEIQAAHHEASRAVMEAMPWVEKEQINLSAGHPKQDICDDVIGAGEGGAGIYPVGTIRLPLHPHCLCYSTAVLMPAEEFTGNLRSWVNGEGDAGMDAYTIFLGVPKAEVPQASLLGSLIAQALSVWLWGQAKEILGRVQ